MKKLQVSNIKTKTSITKYLIGIFPGITRSLAKKILRDKFVLLNGKKSSRNTKVKNGDSLEIHYEEIRALALEKLAEKIKPVDMKLEILYEDEHILAVNKPVGIVIHPVYQHLDDTLLHGVYHYITQNSENPFTKPRPIHRLDKDTSGVILFSKNLDSHKYYADKFMDRQIEKEYLAVAKGDFKKLLAGKKSHNIQSNISKDATNRIYKSTEDGDKAETEVYFEEYWEKDKAYSLLRVLPKTGRTHQIRVHLSELGFPILGDTAYNGDPYKRMMLHAIKLKLEKFDPENKGQILNIEATNTEF